MNLSEEFIRDLTQSQPRLYSYILKLVANVAHAKDVLQETNLVLCRKADDFTPGTTFIAWAYRVAHFQVMAHRQRLARSKVVFNDEVLSQIGEEAEKNEDFDERQVALQDCLKSLPGEQRKLVEERYHEGASVKGIAAAMNKTENAVTKTLQRVRGALLQCIRQRIAEGSA